MRVETSEQLFYTLAFPKNGFNGFDNNHGFTMHVLGRNRFVGEFFSKKSISGENFVFLVYRVIFTYVFLINCTQGLKLLQIRR